MSTIPQGQNLTQSTFISGGNLQNIARQMAVVGVIAIGETFVIITAGIDLSVGSLLGLCGVISPWRSWPVGLPCWSWSASCSLPWRRAAQRLPGQRGQGPAVYRHPGHAGYLARRGLSAEQWDQHSVDRRAVDPRRFSAWVGGATWVSRTSSSCWPCLGGRRAIFLRFTRRGRYIYALGSNPESARLAGINVRATVLTVYAISGAAGRRGWPAADRRA